MSKKNLLCLAIGCFVIFAFASCMTIHPRAKVYFLCFQIVMALIVFVSSLMLGFAVLNDWHKRWQKTFRHVRVGERYDEQDSVERTKASARVRCAKQSSTEL